MFDEHVEIILIAVLNVFPAGRLVEDREPVIRFLPVRAVTPEVIVAEFVIARLFRGLEPRMFR